MGDAMTTKKRINTTEYLSQDILEEDFIKMFSFLLKAQKLLGTCRVDARDRFISAPTILQKLYTIFFTMSILVIFLAAANFYLAEKYPPYSGLQGVATLTMFVTTFTFCCYIIYARFMHNDENVHFYIKMQKIDRLMGIAHNKIMNTILQRANNLSVVILFVLFTCMLLVIMSEGPLAMLVFTASTWILMTVILEITFCSNLTIYFFTRIRLINSILTNFVEGKFPMGKPKYTAPFKHVLRYVAAQTRDYPTSHVDVYLKSILECFINYQDLYRFPVAIYFAILLSYALSTVLFTVLGLKHHLITSADLTIFPFMLVMTFLLGLGLIIRIEFFNREIKETKRLAVVVMSLYFEGPLRAKAKRMLKMIEESPPIFSVYDMWHVNAAFLVRFFNVVSTLVVTLLQFTVL